MADETIVQPPVEAGAAAAPSTTEAPATEKSVEAPAIEKDSDAAAAAPKVEAVKPAPASGKSPLDPISFRPICSLQIPSFPRAQRDMFPRLQSDATLDNWLISKH
jgi:hypothetical protein